MKPIIKKNKAYAFKKYETQPKVGLRFIFKKQDLQKQQYINNQKQIEEAEQAVQSQKSKKKKAKQLIFFLINLVVLAFVLYSQLKQEGVISLVELFSYDLNGWFFLGALLVLILMMILKSVRFNILIKESTGRSRPFLSYKTAALGKYYDNITPMATGGQPFQIYYLNKRGLSASTAISVPLAKYFVNQFAFMTISVIAVVYCFCFNALASSVVVKIVSVVSFSLNILLVVGMILLSVNKRVGRIIVCKVLKFLQKIKIIKNYDKQYNRVMKTVEDYQTSMQNFMKNKWQFIILYIISLIILIMSYSFPYLIYCGMVGFDASVMVDMIVKTAMIEIAASLIPLPGGTGMNEFSFTAVFASFFVEGKLFWALLIYRFFSYYFYLLQGFGVIVYDYLIGNKRYEWMKKKWALQGESEAFKQTQYKKIKKNKK